MLTQKPIFMLPPTSLNLLSYTFFHVDEPLYGIPEAGLQCHHTDHKLNHEKLAVLVAAHDPWFPYTSHNISSDHVASPDHQGLSAFKPKIRLAQK